MRSHEGLVPLGALLLSLTMVPMSGRSSPVPEDASAEPWMDGVGSGHPGQERSSAKSPRNDPSDAEIRQAVSAMERADGYREILEATERYEEIISSARMVELIDEHLRTPALDANRRGLLLLERQLSLDCRLRGATAAARLLSVRLIAGYALLADSPQQFAGVLGKFSQLAGEMNAQLVREALDTPGNAWPKTLLPLMQQFARDWPEYGALAAATRMAEAAKPAAPKNAAPSRGQDLTGHWRSTTISFERARDENLVLRADGTAETWTATASGRTPMTRGRWSSQGTSLRIDWEDGSQRSQPFTFHEGQLVFPNIANRRKFWERID